MRNTLRAHLKSMGADGSFRIEEMRDGTILIIGNCSVIIDEFQGRIVRYRK